MILFTLKTMKLFENGLQPLSGATLLFSMTAVSPASSQHCCRLDAHAWCKRTHTYLVRAEGRNLTFILTWRNVIFNVLSSISLQPFFLQRYLHFQKRIFRADFIETFQVCFRFTRIQVVFLKNKSGKHEYPVFLFV